MVTRTASPVRSEAGGDVWRMAFTLRKEIVCQLHYSAAIGHWESAGRGVPSGVKNRLVAGYIESSASAGRSMSFSIMEVFATALAPVGDLVRGRRKDQRHRRRAGGDFRRHGLYLLGDPVACVRRRSFRANGHGATVEPEFREDVAAGRRQNRGKWLFSGIHGPLRRAPERCVSLVDDKSICVSLSG